MSREVGAGGVGKAVSHSKEGAGSNSGGRGQCVKDWESSRVISPRRGHPRPYFQQQRKGPSGKEGQPGEKLNHR